MYIVLVSLSSGSGDTFLFGGLPTETCARHLAKSIAEQKLSITSAIFQHNNSIHKTTNKTLTLINHILVRQCDLKDLSHQLFHFKPKPRKGGALRKKHKVWNLIIAQDRATSRRAYNQRLKIRTSQ